MRYPWLFLFVLTAVDIIDGCGRTPAAPPSTESPLELSTEYGATNKSSGHHQLDCDDDEILKARCLHDGRCFAFVIDNNRQITCQCHKDYEGDQCQFISHDLFFPVQEDIKIHTASIAAAAVGFTLFCSFIICCVIVKIRKDRNKRDQQNTSNGSALIQPDSNGISIHNGMHNSQEKVPMAEWDEYETKIQIETKV